MSAVVSVAEAAEVLGISKSHAYDLIAQDAFPVRVIRMGRSIRVVRSDLDALLGVS